MRESRKGNIETITKGSILLINFLTVPGKKYNLIVNMDLTKIKSNCENKLEVA